MDIFKFLMFVDKLIEFKDNLRTIETHFLEKLRTTEAHFEFTGPYKKKECILYIRKTQHRWLLIFKNFLFFPCR